MLRTFLIGTFVLSTLHAEMPAIHSAAMVGDVAKINKLIASGITIDEQFVHRNNLIYPDDFYTPLMLACMHNHVDAVRSLLLAGANPNQKSGNALSGAYPITMTDSIAIVRLLLDAGAKVDDSGRSCGHSPLSRHAYNLSPACEAIISLLVSYGADINERDAWGRTILHGLCTGDAFSAYEDDVINHLQRILFLVGLGADVNAQDDVLMTPLHIAIASTRPKALYKTLVGGHERQSTDEHLIYTALIGAGADVDRPDLFGITPRMLMARLEHERHLCLTDVDRAALWQEPCEGFISVWELCLMGDISLNTSYLKFYQQSGIQENIFDVLSHTNAISLVTAWKAEPWLIGKRLVEFMPKITKRVWGEITVLHHGQEAVYKDCKVWPGGTKEWDWNITGTRHQPGIQIADVQELLAKADIFVLSQGVDGVLQVMPETIDYLAQQGKKVVIAKTEEAVELYNKHVAEGKRVAALLHSTC